MRFITALLTGAFIMTVPLAAHTPAHFNKVDSSGHTRPAVQARLPEKKPQTVEQPVQDKAPTDPQPAVSPEPASQPNQPVAEPESITSCEAYRSLIAQYAWNVDVAIAVCNAESSGYAGNDNPGDYHRTCMGSRGLFQIGCDSTDNYAGMFDPSANIAQAYSLYAARGWQPWSATTCRYKVSCY